MWHMNIEKRGISRDLAIGLVSTFLGFTFGFAITRFDPLFFLFDLAPFSSSLSLSLLFSFLASIIAFFAALYLINLIIRKIPSTPKRISAIIGLLFFIISGTTLIISLWLWYFHMWYFHRYNFDLST